MSVEHVKGDVVKALNSGDIDVLVHCVNCQGKMNSGIAKQIREEYPEVYTIFSLDYNDGLSELGRVREVKVNADSCIINLYGQDRYGYDGKRYMHYGAIAMGFSTLMKMYKGKDVTIGLPYKFACDRAGGNWEIISELIEGTLGKVFNVKVYQLEEIR